MNNALGMAQFASTAGQVLAASQAGAESSTKLKLESAIGAANNLINRVRNMADALCGEALTEKSDETPRPKPDGVLPTLADSAEYLMRNATEAHAALDRIERELL